MRLRATTLFAAAALVCLTAAAGWAQLAPYSQDFEGLTQSDPAALSSNGWLVYGNVFDPAWNWIGGYGPYPAPNGGAAFSAVAAGEGGVPQGAQQLSVYNDYNNGEHANGNWVEANVFQEQVVGAGNVGDTWDFTFDAKMGNLELRSTALAFIKTLNPNAGYAMTNFITVDMTSIPTTWGSYGLSIVIDASLVGQILQIGFMNVATNYEGAGVFYDNINFAPSGPVSVEEKSWSNAKSLYR